MPDRRTPEFDDDDDDDFLETVTKMDNQQSKPARKSSVPLECESINDIFGSPSPLSRLKSRKLENKENIRDRSDDLHSKIWPKLNLFDEEDVGSSTMFPEESVDDLGEDDVPLVNQRISGNENYDFAFEI